MKTNINQLLAAFPRSSRYGAPMGVRNVDGAGPGTRLHLQRIHFVDGDYGPDGTYWGGPPSEPLWAAFTPSLSTLWYVRAKTRALACQAVLSDLPEAKLVRRTFQ